MSGKASGKKRNRAAQSEQHGYQQAPSEKKAGADAGDNSGGGKKGGKDHKRVLDKLKDLEKQRRQKEEDKPGK